VELSRKLSGDFLVVVNDIPMGFLLRHLIYISFYQRQTQVRFQELQHLENMFCDRFRI
jgi:hypothetical protein